MNDTLLSRITREVARETGSDPTSLPPLYDAVDTDALEALYDASESRSEHRSDPTVQFRYAGRTVVVQSPSDIEVTDRPTIPSEVRIG